MKAFKCGIVQFDVRLGDVERNVAAAQKRIVKLAQEGAELVVLPEMWSTGFANERLDDLAGTTSEVLEGLRDMAKSLKLIIIGSLPEKREKGVCNTAYVVDGEGSVAALYRKVHLFSPTGEDRFFRAGEEAVVARTAVGCLGLMICYDLRFPELCRALVLKGATVVVVMAEWPAARRAHWDVLLKARAVENQIYVIGANRCGRDDDLVYAGHSRIVGPFGEVIARAGKGPANLLGSIDPYELARRRKQIPCLQERVPGAYV